MTTGKDIASFFENGTTKQFEFCYSLYPQVLKLKAEKRNKKPQELIRLDEWYQNELPKLIKARGKDAHMVYDELVQTMKWKQSRGKFYPQLSYLVKVNTPRAVMQETKKAFRKLPNLEQAITALSNLKGVGTTMASALLAAAAPDKAPFMADECLMAIPEIEGIDYTTKEYLNFVQHIQATVDRLNKEAGFVVDGDVPPFWSPHRVELALWAHYVANDLSPELLDEMPGPGAGGGGGVNTNGSTILVSKGLDGGGGDTTDVDEESQGAGTVGRSAGGNNTATESENENTNPAAALSAGVLQDGDSNFISNDSTSQEPLIDENTTQTTATTSTDGEENANTPLASDSESNLEAPPTSKAANIIAAAATTNAIEIVTPIHAAAATEAAAETATITTNDTINDSTVLVVGNGNGTLHSSAAGDSLDGENSNCLREVEELDDDSSSNNTNNGLGKSLTPIILNDGTNDDSVETTTTLSSSNTGAVAAAAAAVGQKRTLHCGGESSEDQNSQPDIKKVRSD